LRQGGALSGGLKGIFTLFNFRAAPRGLNFPRGFLLSLFSSEFDE